MLTQLKSFYEKKKSKKKSKEKPLKVGDRVVQKTSGIEGTVLVKPTKDKKYIPIKWDGSSQTTQHVDSIKKVEK
jgi:dsDNA-specific endonuclease/ATPase MutS2